MLAPHSRLRRKEEEIVAKVMDGEAVIINLSNGMYYSLDNVGAAIWEFVGGEYRLDEIAAAIVARYEVEPEPARDDVLRLAAELLREELVEIAPGDEVPHRPSQPAETGKLPYEAPQLNAYTDMEDLLALDPPTPGLGDIPWKG